MTARRRDCASSPAYAARIALAAAGISLGALALAGQASADPADPAVPTPVPGQPVVEALDSAPAAPAPPPPVGTPTVPEIQNPQYGSGNSSGPLGFLRDAWHQAQDPYNFAGTPDGMPTMSPPPPGAGPAPQLPPGYTSLNAPESNGPPAVGTRGGAKLPPGYYSLNGPPPPGYFDGPVNPDPLAIPIPTP